MVRSIFIARTQSGINRGITIDGSNLYPVAIQAVWGDLPHQICEFHILKDLNQAVLRAVAQVRKQLAAQQPKLKRGRPKADQKKQVQKRQRLQQKISDLFEYRFLFVQHHLTHAERTILQQITRGLPHLRVLRQIVDRRMFNQLNDSDILAQACLKLGQHLHQKQ
jgi:hypothetical protein